MISYNQSRNPPHFIFHSNLDIILQFHLLIYYITIVLHLSLTIFKQFFFRFSSISFVACFTSLIIMHCSVDPCKTTVCNLSTHLGIVTNDLALQIAITDLHPNYIYDPSYQGIKLHRLVGQQCAVGDILNFKCWQKNWLINILCSSAFKRIDNVLNLNIILKHFNNYYPTW